jgi:hypothetical protein
MVVSFLDMNIYYCFNCVCGELCYFMCSLTFSGVLLLQMLLLLDKSLVDNLLARSFKLFPLNIIYFHCILHRNDIQYYLIYLYNIKLYPFPSNHLHLLNNIVLNQSYEEMLTLYFCWLWSSAGIFILFSSSKGSLIISLAGYHHLFVYIGTSSSIKNSGLF